MTRDDENLEDEPLSWIALAVPWEYYELDPADPHVVRVGYRVGGTLQEHVPLSDVTVAEQWDPAIVSVLLRYRTLNGTSGDGTVYGELLVHGHPAWIELRLSSPLGGRPLVDGSTGDQPPRLSEADAESVWHHSLKARCARWIC